MRNKKAAYLCMVIVLLMTAGCGHSDTDSNVSTVDTINFNDEINTNTEENNSNNQQQAQEQAVSYSDEELEEKLAAYRQAREEKIKVSQTDMSRKISMCVNIVTTEHGNI